VTAFEAGELHLSPGRKPVAGLTADEARVLKFLRG
jgi:hypothetical protein